jgi:tRNA(Ile)-lysidine synthetase-like protein
MYSEYLDVLEYQPKLVTPSLVELSKEPIYVAIEQFMKKNLRPQQTHICVSLSGGVDSMIIATCLNMLFKSSEIKVIGAHVEYANRQESSKEAKFVELWCKDNDIIFEKEAILDFKRDEMERNDYEEVSRKLRFGLYQRLISQFGCNGICLGHHAGDIAENVLTNAIHGRDLLDLEVIKPITQNQDILFWRPLVSCYKDIIFQFADKYQVPYFKDTTPDWSNRGFLRRQLIPLCESRYGHTFKKNLVSIGKQSTQWADLITTKIIDPFMQQHVKIGQFGVVINFSEHANSPSSLWSVILRNVLHGLHHHMVSHATLETLVSILNSKKRNCQFNMGLDLKSYITESRLIILLSPAFFHLSQTPVQLFNTEIDFNQGVKIISLQHCEIRIESIAMTQTES